MGWLHCSLIFVFSGLVAALHHIPDVVWAALVAAGVAFLTTTLSNRNSRKQLQMQLDNDARQRKLDRQMSLRRDVYLPAIKAITRMQGSLGRLGGVGADQEKVGEQIVADLSTLAKVHLVASEATVAALVNYQKTFMPAYFEMLELRQPLIARQRAIELQQTFMDAALAEHQHLVHLMRDHTLSGNPDPAPLDRLNSQSSAQMKLYKETSQNKALLQADQKKAQLDVTERLSELLAITAPLIPVALLSARRDLDLALDDTRMATLYSEQQEAAVQTLRDIVRRARGPNQPPPKPPAAPQVSQ